MQKIKSPRSLVALAATSVALSAFSGAVQAQGAFDWDFRDSDTNNSNRDNSRRVDRDDFGTFVSLEAVVTNARYNNDFEMRAGGRIFLVRNVSNTSVRLGDRVIVRGSFGNSNQFNGESVRVLGRDNGRGNDVFEPNPFPGMGSRVDFSATLIRVNSRREIEVRADNGRTYRVESRNDAHLFRIGTRLRIVGESNGSVVRNASVFLGSGTGGSIFGDPNTSSASVNVDFPGRIVRIDTFRAEAVVRGDNGRDYTVRGREVANFQIGDRVRVRGVSRFGVVEVRDLSRVF